MTRTPGGLRLYFAYGSNLDVDQMRARCPSSRARFRARLLDHQIDFTHYSQRWQGGAADVLPQAKEQVWGVVYELEVSDFALLDRYESGYDRIRLEVIDDARCVHEITSYSVRRKGRYEPHQLYLQKMLIWGAHWGFPTEYLDWLRLRG